MLVSRTLGLLYRDVNALAARANMSRSAFRSRFSSLVGEPPARYLTRWRMHTALDLLRRGDAPLRDIAAHVGYECPISPRAFSESRSR